MLTVQELHDGQNHSFSNVSNSSERNFSKEVLTLSAMRTDAMSSFYFLTAEQKQLPHVIVVLKVLESKSSVLINVSFNLSKTTCRISAASCREFKSKGTLQMEEMLHLSAHRKLEGSIFTTYVFLIAIFNEIDFNNGDNCADSAKEVLQI